MSFACPNYETFSLRNKRAAEVAQARFNLILQRESQISSVMVALKNSKEKNMHLRGKIDLLTSEHAMLEDEKAKHIQKLQDLDLECELLTTSLNNLDTVDSFDKVDGEMGIISQLDSTNDSDLEFKDNKDNKNVNDSADSCDRNRDVSDERGISGVFNKNSEDSENTTETNGDEIHCVGNNEAKSDHVSGECTGDLQIVDDNSAKVDSILLTGSETTFEIVFENTAGNLPPNDLTVTTPEDISEVNSQVTPKDISEVNSQVTPVYISEVNSQVSSGDMSENTVETTPVETTPVPLTSVPLTISLSCDRNDHICDDKYDSNSNSDGNNHIYTSNDLTKDSKHYDDLECHSDCCEDLEPHLEYPNDYRCLDSSLSTQFTVNTNSHYPSPSDSDSPSHSPSDPSSPSDPPSYSVVVSPLPQHSVFLINPLKPLSPDAQSYYKPRSPCKTPKTYMDKVRYFSQQ